MFCFHKWGKIEEGYQYCSKCNAARPVKCNHKWVTLNSGDISRRSPYSGEWRCIGKSFYSRCEKCGEHQKEELILDCASGF